MNTSLHFPIAALPEHPELAETISFQLSGLVVVFLVLGSIWFLLEIMGKIFALRAKSAPVPSLAAPIPQAAPAPLAASADVSALPANAPQPSGDDTIAPETLALIATAVHLAVGAGHRIIAITPSTINPNWAMEGRRQIFASHRPR